MNIGHREFSAEDPSATTRRPSRAPAASMRTGYPERWKGFSAAARGLSSRSTTLPLLTLGHTWDYVDAVHGRMVAR